MINNELIDKKKEFVRRLNSLFEFSEVFRTVFLLFFSNPVIIKRNIGGKIVERSTKQTKRSGWNLSGTLYKNSKKR